MSNPTVFVIDDHPAVLGAMDALLNISGFAARCFLSPADFFAQYTPTQRGCLMVDLLMPGVDGALFMKQLRTVGCQLPVVMTSNLIEAENAQRWLDMGVFAVLRKPFEAADFLITLNQAMRLTSYALACGSLKSMLLAPF